MNHRLGVSAVVAVSLVAALSTSQPSMAGYAAYGAFLAFRNLVVYAGLVALYHGGRALYRRSQGEPAGENGE